MDSADMRRPILIVLATEIALFLVSRLILSYWAGEQWQSELMRTACRAGAAFVLWRFLGTVIFSAVPQPGTVRHPLFFAAVGVFLAVPLLVGNWYYMGPVTKIVFAATSVVVGIHEEFLFRGIMQNLLSKRLGILPAIGMTSAVMTAWHVGALPPNFFNFSQIFIASCVLGLIYAGTGSIRMVVILHSLYDALWSLTPLLAKPLSWPWGIVLLAAALGCTWLWARRESQLNLFHRAT